MISLYRDPPPHGHHLILVDTEDTSHNIIEEHHNHTDDDDNNHSSIELAEFHNGSRGGGGDDIFQDEPTAKDDDDDDDGCCREQHPEEQEEEQHTPTVITIIIGSTRTPWYGTAIILLSEVMGTGILSLPYAAKMIGWTSTMVAVPLFCVLATYSGFLLSRVYCLDSSSKPGERERGGGGGGGFHSFAQAATELLGPKFGRLTQSCMLVNWGATAIYYLIATADGIADIVPEGVLECSYQRSLVAVILLVLPCQCRDFYSISKYLSLPSTCAILLMVAIVIGNLLSTFSASSSSFGDTTTMAVPETTTPLDYLEALSAFVFAYQGHAIFLELMSEMKEASQFPKSCGLAYALMSFMYALTVLVAYGIRGVETEEFLPEMLAAGTARTLVGVLVCIHIAVSYVIACQPLHMWLHVTLFPSTFQLDTTKGSIHWFLLTAGYLAFGYVIGNCIPFFAAVQALIGSLFGAPTIFAWPVAFYLATSRQRVNSWGATFQLVGWPQTMICGFFLLICTPVFVVLGTSGAIKSIVEDAKNAAEPFTCVNE